MILYRHIRLDKNEVFYVGIGSEYKRAYSKYNRNKYWKNIVNKTQYRVDILFDDLNYNDVKEKEIEFIKLYGRKDLGLGTLVNMTDGGDGSLGCHPSIETRRKISEGGKNRIFTKERNKKISDSKLGKLKSEETKLKMKKAWIDRKEKGYTTWNKGLKFTDKKQIKNNN